METKAIRKTLSPFFNDEKEPAWTFNPFTQNLMDVLYKKKKIKEKTIAAVVAYEGGHIEEVFTEPQNLLDYDASLYPNYLNVGIIPDKLRLGDCETALFLSRANSKMLFSLGIGLYEENNIKSPFNFTRMQYEMVAGSDQYGLIGDGELGDYGSRWFQLHFIKPAKGNMLETFNEAWANIQKLHAKSIQGMVKDIKKNY